MNTPKPVSQKAFSAIAKYYDTIYHRKNYTREVLELHSLIKKHTHTPSPSILDIGVGTGEHLLEFIRLGYSGTGIDSSHEMLNVAKNKINKSGAASTLQLADARNFELHKKFDVVVSLFHVLSYQTTGADVTQFFARAAHHMKRNAVLIFDCWYGPGVLTDPPKKTKQIYHQGDAVIHKYKDPNHHIHTNTVTVNQRYVITTPKSKPLLFTEAHEVRYFFYPEIETYLHHAGLKIVAWGNLGKTLTHPKDNAWEVYFVAKKIS